MPVIGQSVIRRDIEAKVKGEALFSTDITLPNQLYMKILFARRPHAIVRKIDASAAEAMPGVIAVFTARDIPVNEFGYMKNDQPVLCGPGSSKPYTDRVRFIGDKVAIIVAETEEIAAKARDRLVVDYEDLPAVIDPIKGMQPDAALLHPELGTNIMDHHKIYTGDVGAAFARADVIVEGDYHTPAQEHAYMETEAGVSYIDEEGRVTVVATGQWAHHIQKQIAHALDLPEDRIRVIHPYIGGAFGGREDVSVQIILALATWRLNQRGINRPIKVVTTREESIIGHSKRHPYHIHTKWAATKDGIITAAEVKMITDGGAYLYTSSIISSVAILNCTGPYDIPNVKVDSYDIYTNTIPRAAFRGFGGPQGAFVAESQINKLAEKLGMDAVELRMRNLVVDGTLQSVGAPFPPGVSIREVVEKCALAAGWEKTYAGWANNGGVPAEVINQPYLKHGIGLGCSHKNAGFAYGFREYCWVTLELYGKAEIDRVVLKHTATEVGQGTYSALAQMTAEALNVPLDKVEVSAPDTAISQDTGAVSASRMTFFAGNAIREAAEIALDKWRSEERPVCITHKYIALPTTAPDPLNGHCDPMVSYAYTATTAEVEVDTETGQVRILKVICANDIGKAINPQQVEGQLEGGLVQAAGYVVLENFIEKDGYVLTPSFSTYLIPTALDIPEQMEVIILEYPDPRGPWGARGVGEMPFLPFAPAVTAAVHAATGVWFDEFPLTPERVLKGLGKM
ncbi:MAG: xanthine dehydrogenase family protein molybdopterin-binding subunit [Leptolinea sp.]